jgi:sugar O-acyltransferase (sialic acid O-acetyltransferase NeuD family)
MILKKINMIKKYQKKQVKGILLWGGKSKARIMNEMLHEIGLGGATLIYDATLDAPSFTHNAYFINDLKKLRIMLNSVSHYVVCIGGENGYARVKIANFLDKMGLSPITLVHEKTFIDPTSTIETGCQIMPSVVIHKFSIIQKHTIINTNASIDHECSIGEGVHIMGSAALAGKILVGNYATVGTNATILPHINIGEGAIVGAGAVVTKDVDPYTVVVGVPAKKIRMNRPKYFDENIE